MNPAEVEDFSHLDHHHTFPIIQTNFREINFVNT